MAISPCVNMMILVIVGQIASKRMPMFYPDPKHWRENEDCWVSFPNEAQRPKIEAEGRERGGVLGELARDL